MFPHNDEKNNCIDGNTVLDLEVQNNYNNLLI